MRYASARADQLRQTAPRRAEPGSKRQRATDGPVQEILRLQRLAGNEAVSQLLQVSRDGPAGTAAVEPKVDKAQAAFEVFDAAFEQQATKSKDPDHAALYLYWAYGGGMANSYYYQALDAAHGDKVAWKQGLEQFRTRRGDEVIANLRAEPDSGLAVWKSALARIAPHLGSNADPFIEQVESAILPAYARKEARKTGKTPTKLQAIADLHIRPLIVEDLQMLLIGATQAVAVWGGLPIPKKHGKSGAFEAGAAGTHFAMEAAEALFDEASLIVEIGIPELAVVKFGLELAGIMSAEAEQEEWEYKLQKKQDYDERARETLIEMYNGIVAHTKRQMDVLTLLCASRALQAKINPESPVKLKLTSFVREQVFGKDFPADESAAFERAKSKLYEISQEYQQKLKAE